MDRIKMLKKMSFFAYLPDETLEQISKQIELRKYSNNELIFEEGSIGSKMYMIDSGSVEVLRRIGKKKQDTMVSLRELEAGDFFGEMALFDERQRSASIRSINESRIYCISREKFFEICHDHQDVLKELFKLMTIRFREFNEQYTQLWNQVKEEKKLNAIGTATAKIIHDLKAPLTAINLSAQMLEHKKSNFEKNLKRIKLQTEYAHEMVMSILEIAKEPEKMVHNKSVDLNELFELMLGLLEPQMQESNVKIIIDHKGDNNVSVDPLNMRRALMNILVNGIEAIKHDEGLINITSSVSNKVWKLKISDNGPGIPSEILPRIFDPFFSMGKANGTGFGLAISKKIIVLHGGSIRAGNNKEKGAYFEFEMPC